MSRISRKPFSSRCHVLVECSLRPLPSCRFIAYLFSVTTLSVIDLVGKEQNNPLCFCSLEWNVWQFGQSDSTHRKLVAKTILADPHMHAPSKLTILPESALERTLPYRSCRSRCRKGIQFVASLQSCSQVHSYAPSNENTGCKKMLASQLTKVKSKREVTPLAEKIAKRNIIVLELIFLLRMRNCGLE